MKFDFQNDPLLAPAFIHRSFLNENKVKKLQSNERLEFLGDAVLELVVSYYLFNIYPDFEEGQLTSLRSKLVQTKTLSLASQRLNFGKFLKLSKGEAESGGGKNDSILADTFEAVIGIIYQNYGFQEVYDFVINNLLIPAKILFNDQLPKDYKSLFQELVQNKGKPSPIYKVISTTGPDHNKIFKIAVFVDNQKLAEGLGKSKQTAEQEAAKAALVVFKI